MHVIWGMLRSTGKGDAVVAGRKGAAGRVAVLDVGLGNALSLFSR